MNDRERTFWLITVIALVGACILAIRGERAMGRAEMKAWQDAYYQAHPVVLTYQPDTLVITHAEKVCPEGHTCRWRAWDLDTDAELGKTPPAPPKPKKSKGPCISSLDNRLDKQLEYLRGRADAFDWFNSELDKRFGKLWGEIKQAPDIQLNPSGPAAEVHPQFKIEDGQIWTWDSGNKAWVHMGSAQPNITCAEGYALDEGTCKPWVIQH